MALDDAYATASEYRSVIEKTDSGSDSQIDLDLKAISRVVEAIAGGIFNQTDDVVARRLTPSVAGTTLSVPPIASRTDFEIVVDQYRTGSFADLTPLTTEQYQLAHNGNYEPELFGLPWNQIIIPSWSSAYLWSPTAPVQVTAVWGWPAVPEAIKRGCIDLTGILRLETPRATRTMNLTINEVQGMSRQAQDIVTSLMLTYHPTGGVVIA